MKGTLLKKLTLLIFSFFAVATMHSQILDGTVQSSRFRVSLPATVNFDDGTVNSSPYISYKQNVSCWMKSAFFAQYNIEQEAFIPQMWIELSAYDCCYLLSRSIYNCSTKKYSHGLAGTIKLPLHLSVDATWDNMFQQVGGEKLDRFQVVGGCINRRFIANAGYSMLYKEGFIANLRLIFSKYYFLQMKYDGGLNTFTFTSYINL